MHFCLTEFTSRGNSDEILCCSPPVPPKGERGGWNRKSEWEEEIIVKSTGPGRGTVGVSGIGAHMLLVQGVVVGLRVVEAAGGWPGVPREGGAGTGRGRGGSCERRRTDHGCWLVIGSWGDYFLQPQIMTNDYTLTS